MTIKEFLLNYDEEEFNNVIISLVCPIEFDLKCFDDFENINMCNNDIKTCARCWEYALS